MYSLPKKAVEKPTTILAYMIAAELLRQNYEISYPDEIRTDHYNNGIYRDRKYEVKSKKFEFHGRMKYTLHKEYNKTELSCYFSNYVSFNTTEYEIIKRAFHISLLQVTEKKKIDDEVTNQEAALKKLENWVGLV